ncbi:glutamate--tRNA ligase [Halothermothrix orenii]|uniref:Glutamate--tRNA ligase n=1 Tax=Halothermothrix orenii (strain H 168 / OCM 544 / DSM 9562) TaxID=373903 RepID=B8D0A2_HALOH|nr:glutamate--tRNA ligase [Halothermothrix orenii]ACL68856.1 glutamyl-tRNA synthetase [Halothermothrix orenii H 168]
MGSIRLRFPPSPTGRIHIGNIRTALFNWLWARKQGGTLVLRIEDTDRERSATEFEEIIIRELQWLGLDVDEGVNKGGDYGPYRQSERLDIYKKYANKLLEEDKAYYCYCTPEELEQMRKEARARGEMPRYNGRCRHLTDEERKKLESEGRKPVIRFKLPDEEQEIIVNDQIKGKVSFQTSVLDDFIIFKSDGMPTYNFAVVIDDALMKITDVIRGEDHLSNTPKQLLLYEALGFEPPRFAHLPLILNKDREKLKKRSNDDAVYIGEYRRKGYLPEALFNYLALLGWAPRDGQELLSREELIRRFELKDVNKSGAVFDIDKLNWLNGKYIRNADIKRIVDLSIPYLKEAGLITGEVDASLYRWLVKVIDVARTGVDYLKQIPEETSLFFKKNVEFEDKSKAIEEFSQDGVTEVFTTLVNKLKQLETLTPEAIDGIFKEMKKELPVSPRTIYHPVRLALTGLNSGPEIKNVIYILGINEVEKRLNEALNMTE